MILGGDVGELRELLTGRAWSPAAARRQVHLRAARYRAAGVEPGDVAFLHLGNRLELFADLLALWGLGACVAPLDPRLTPFEVETLARAAAPRLSLWPATPEAAVTGALAGLGVAVLESPEGREADGGDGEPAWPGPGPELDRDALVLFTSGSTGRPKGVVHTHRSLLARWTSLAAHVGTAGLGRTLCLLPTHFGHGLICNALFPWLSGRWLGLLPSFRPDVILRLGALVDEHRVTFMSSVPALWRLALRTARPPRAGTLARVFCGSAPLSAAMWRDASAWAGGAPVSNVYGITEAASWLAGTAPDAVPEDGLVGEPWGARIAVVPGGEAASPAAAAPAAPGEPGRVWVRTPALMRGYLGRADLTEAAVRGGWLATGDVGSLDERGRLRLHGRERDEVNRGGLKVYPEDVDAVLERFDQADDACAFGYEDGAGQEEVGVAVVLRARDAATIARLHAWARQRLAPHQMPRRWYLLDEIPRSGRGKVDRAQVAARCAALAPVDARTLRAAGAEGGGDA